VLTLSELELTFRENSRLIQRSRPLQIRIGKLIVGLSARVVTGLNLGKRLARLHTITDLNQAADDAAIKRRPNAAGPIFCPDEPARIACLDRTGRIHRFSTNSIGPTAKGDRTVINSRRNAWPHAFVLMA
jgi:hypothetical protein